MLGELALDNRDVMSVSAGPPPKPKLVLSRDAGGIHTRPARYRHPVHGGAQP
jgi:hypothetical protein